MEKKQKPDIPAWLLWEYDYEKFNWDKSAKIAIERVLERGNLHEWCEIKRYYSLDKILETIEWSAQLGKREKEFARFFIHSHFLDAA